MSQSSQMATSCKNYRLSAYHRKHFFRVTWTPSHCDVEGPKREQDLKAGTINEKQVDILAKLGANTYALDEQVLDAIQRRTAITMLVQNMMVMIWTQKRQNEKDAKDALALALAAEDIPCEFNLVDQQVDYNNDDYDPFGNGMCNADGEDIPMDTSTIPTPTHPEYLTPEIQAKCPG